MCSGFFKRWMSAYKAALTHLLFKFQMGSSPTLFVAVTVAVVRS